MIKVLTKKITLIGTANKLINKYRTFTITLIFKCDSEDNNKSKWSNRLLLPKFCKRIIFLTLLKILRLSYINEQSEICTTLQKS